MILWLFLSSAWAVELSRTPITTNEAAQVAVDSLVRGVTPAPVTECQQLAPVTDCSPANFQQYPKGGHGQLFFGNGPFYISHLPLWFQPHNFQAIYEVDFPDTDAGKAMREKYKNRKDQGYATFNPQHLFKIPEFNCNVGTGERELPGSLFEGHFERGGESLGGVKLIVKRRIYYRELDTNQAEPEEPADGKSNGEFISFGEGDQFFAARVVTRRPAVDHIMPLKNKGYHLTQVAGANHACFNVSHANNNMKFVPKKCEDPSAPAPVSQNPSTEAFNPFYLETGELQ